VVSDEVVCMKQRVYDSDYAQRCRDIHASIRKRSAALDSLRYHQHIHQFTGIGALLLLITNICYDDNQTEKRFRSAV